MPSDGSVARSRCAERWRVRRASSAPLSTPPREPEAPACAQAAEIAPTAPKILVDQQSRDHEGHGVSLRPAAEGAYQETWQSAYTSTKLSRSAVQLMASFDRLLLTCLLGVLLSLKASREEDFLIDKHAQLYAAYAEDVPQLVPTPASVWSLLRGSEEP